MNETKTTFDTFNQYINTAALSLKKHELEEAYDLIIEALHIAPDAPQPHNLLGIWFELKGDGDKARRHYRAAYALDPTFKPACRNLEHICNLYGSIMPYSYDFGDAPEETNAHAGRKNRAERDC